MTAPRARRTVVKPVAVALCAALAAGPVGLSTAAAAEPGTVTVDAVVTAEAWYRTALLADVGADLLCGVVVCPTVAADTYPPGTLHVGVTAGQPDSMTVIGLQPPTAAVAGGTLVVPVAGPDAGSVAADRARILACIAFGPFDDTRGGDPQDAPRVTCGWSSPAVADPDDPALLRVDLEPLVPGWPDGADAWGVALVVDPADEATATWHVAISTHDREVEVTESVPVSATFAVAASAAPRAGDQSGSARGDSSADPAGPALQPPAVPMLPAVPLVPPRAGAPTEPPGSVQPPVVAPDADRDQEGAPPAATAAQSVTLPYPWPVVWLLPLALLVLVVGLWRSLREEVTVRSARGGVR